MKQKAGYFTPAALTLSVVTAAMADGIPQSVPVRRALWLGAVQIGPWMLHPLVLVFALSGSLMISKTLRIPKF